MSKTITQPNLDTCSRSCSSKKEWSSFQHVMAYLSITDDIPHRSEGEAVLLEHIPTGPKRVLDLGTGNGRLLRIMKINRPNIEAVGVDISPLMLKEAKESFLDRTDYGDLPKRNRKWWNELREGRRRDIKVETKTNH